MYECVFTVGGFARSLIFGYTFFSGVVFTMEKYQEVEHEEVEQVYEGEESSEPR